MSPFHAPVSRCSTAFCCRHLRHFWGRILAKLQLQELQEQLDSLRALSKQAEAPLALPAAAGSSGAAGASEPTAAVHAATLPGPEGSAGSAEAWAADDGITATVPHIEVAQRQPAVTHRSVLEGLAAAVPTIDDTWQGVDSQVEALLKARFFHTGADFNAQELTTAIQLSARGKAVCSNLSEGRQAALAELRRLSQQPASKEQAFSLRLAAQTHQVAGLVRFDEVRALHEAGHRSAGQQAAGQGNSSSAGQLQEGSQGLEQAAAAQAAAVPEPEQEGSQGGGQQQLQSDGEGTEDADTETEEGEVPQQEQPAVGKRSMSPSTEAPSLKRQCTGGHTGAERGALSAVENTM